jgi:hypothetical protein
MLQGFFIMQAIHKLTKIVLLVFKQEKWFCLIKQNVAPEFGGDLNHIGQW